MLSKVLYEVLNNESLVARYKDASKDFVLSEYNWKDKVGLHPRFQQRLPKTRGIS